MQLSGHFQIGSFLKRGVVLAALAVVAIMAADAPQAAPRRAGAGGAHASEVASAKLLVSKRVKLITGFRISAVA
ncbi:MAG TPA: hypothetical protein DEB06_00735 [Phycisphaerales bacterium]|nr:hypothetical protein [Phycisphaerales bacterium]